MLTSHPPLRFRLSLLVFHSSSSRLGALGVILFLLFWLMPDSSELTDYFLRAGSAAWQNANPYSVAGFFTPPQVLALLTPLSLLPTHLANVILHVLNFGSFALVAYRLGASRLTFTLFMLSPLVIGAGFHNLDGMTLLGLVIPPTWGLFFLLLKPQLGGIYAVYLLMNQLRSKGIAGVVRTVAPLAFVWLLGLVAFGPWPLSMIGATKTWWNFTVFPYLVPVGLALVVYLFRKHDARFAPAAGLCLSPYVGMGSWSGALLILVNRPAEMLAAVVGTWMVQLALLR